MNWSDTQQKTQCKTQANIARSPLQPAQQINTKSKPCLVTASEVHTIASEAPTADGNKMYIANKHLEAYTTM